MASLAGAFLASAVGLFNTVSRLDRGRAFHGAFDSAHDAVESNPGVPGQWPGSCRTYAVTAAGLLSWVLASGRLRAAA
jgi:hypothetical protein